MKSTGAVAIDSVFFVQSATHTTNIISRRFAKIERGRIYLDGSPFVNQTWLGSADGYVSLQDPRSLVCGLPGGLAIGHLSGNSIFAQRFADMKTYQHVIQTMLVIVHFEHLPSERRLRVNLAHKRCSNNKL